MKLGVNLVNFGPAATPEALLKWAETVEGLGYHHLMTSDHVTVTPEVADRFPAPFYEPWTMLGWLAAYTNNIAIGVSVIVLPYRSPLEVARAMANADRLSGGRCILGVGVGWARDEYAALNVPFEKRGAIASEYLAVIRQLWTEEISSFEGKFVQFENVHSAPLPARPLPVWVGGRSPGALRRVMRLGDAWHPFRITTDWLRDEGIPQLRETAAREEKPVPGICPRILLRLTDNDLPDGERVAGEGSLDQVRADLAALEEMGCTDVLLDTYTDDGEAAQNPEYAWAMLETVAEKIFDLNTHSVR